MTRTWPDYYEDSLHSTTIGLCRQKGWLIVLTCSTCGHGGKSGAVIEWPDLLQFRQDMTEAELAANAIFARCGHRGAWIDHRQDPASKAGAALQGGGAPRGLAQPRPHIDR